MQLGGVWIPLVTPFRESRLDLPSLQRLVEDLVPRGIAGLVAGATTGESLVLSQDELSTLVRAVKDAAGGRVPVLAGAGGPDTRRVIASVARAAQAGADGVLSICPYYTRPDQRGILAHFQAVAASTPLPVVLYNNPVRAAVRMHNDTIRRLAEIDNVVGLKDCAGDVAQSMELLLDPPPRFAILTGEDALFYPMLTLGAAGGILAAAHWATGSFVEVWRAVERNDHRRAREIWALLLPGTRLLFEEPSPAPIKHLLEATGRIASGELRLPLVPPGDALKRRLAALGGAAPA